ncbi:MAG: 4Fe-4S binding protein [Schaedlerella sp.]|uniref:NADH-ubiquinone oxidoreductase-F iron-sulfur binding region domain-containing protein n=1 Tax=Schaedlerella sp. TaxID=2676057 RepID=UPI00260F5A19|nr:NADH-ubiquinone oxidoreductase-F iron-sulfur binding region domain-containing protein [uncultured Schaedlerella sp.]
MSTLEKIKSLKNTECIVDVLLKEVLANECRTCGKCVFGYEGITQLELILGDITVKKGKSTDLELLRELGEMMAGQSLCEKGEEIAQAVLEAVELYQSDFEDHIGKKGCRAGVCKKFMTYHILAEKCVGCGDCMDACDEDAILGKARFVHVIAQDECTQCGACMDACDEDAVVQAGAVKPRCPRKPVPCKKR